MWSGATACALVLPVLVTVPVRCSLAPPRDERGPISVPSEQAPPGPPIPSISPGAPRAVLPEEVVVRAMSAGQAAFLRCWSRAQLVDPPDMPNKVRLHIELDAAGAVTAVSSDCESPALARCITLVARHLPFPAPGQAALVELPLFFQ